MTHFVGIDVSLETSCVCIVDASGRVVRELIAESEPEVLATALLDTKLDFSRVGLEAGPMSQWLHAGLAQVGLPAVLIETRRLRAAPKTMPIKTDRNDARAIAQVVRTGWFRAVHVKSVLSQELRGLLGARKLLVGKVRDLDNAVRALLRSFGLKMGQIGERAFAERARELVEGRAALQTVLAPLLEARAALLAQRDRLHRMVLMAVRSDPICRRLMTVPGVGPVTALTFCSAVDDPNRFTRSRAVGAHFGLTPRRYQSGETDRTGHISKQGDALARQALYEAANVLLTRTQRWSALKAWGITLAKRAGMRRAKVAVARKLAVVLHRMWRDGTEFRWSRGATAA
ncbi:IS110 family transposase [Methylobacterium sp. GC_Met_2]|uniref:IS110 family transposase n=1 Tax=Methylobacterium sp. GC_Met_2 TaxID=2937376 RepID=UPI00226B1509|nr:IS110 family transposase [Methylobacterium sp. GC_Met_2]